MRSRTLEQPGSLMGVQEARLRSVPPYAHSSGHDAIDLARMAGIDLDPWQENEIVDGMGESADWKCSKCPFRSSERTPCPEHPRAALIHPWAAFEVVDVVPRQNGKSEKLIVRQLAGLFILEEPLQIYSAHLFDTSMEIFRRLVQVVENCDDLRREVKHRGSKMVGIKYSHGEEGIELRDGRRIRFKARTAGGGRGFSCDTLYLDEAMILPERFLGGTVPTLSAKPNPQIWIAGSAPDELEPSHDGIVLAKRRERAQAGGDPGLAYFEHSAVGDDPDELPPGALDDPEQWALGNPGMGRRIGQGYIANERRAMGSRQFAVERLGITRWPKTSDEADRVISREMWADLADDDPENRVVGVPAFALDASPDLVWGSIGVSGVRADDRWQVAVADHRRGTEWIVDRAADLIDAHPGSCVVVDVKGPLGFLIPELVAAGLHVVSAGTEDYSNACADFYSGVTNATVRYPDPQPELERAVSAARWAPLGDRRKWSRRTSTSPDISPLVSVTLALWGARTMVASEPWVVMM